MPLQKPCYIDPRTGRNYELSDVRWRSDDGHPMMVTELAGIDRQDIDTRLRSLWRYQAALPLPIAQPVSLGEAFGMSPFFRISYALSIDTMREAITRIGRFCASLS